MNSESVNNNGEHKKTEGSREAAAVSTEGSASKPKRFERGSGEGRDGYSVSNAVLFNRRSLSRRRSGNALLAGPNAKIDYKNVTLLSNFISDKGRILPRRITGASAKKQRQIKHAIKRARELGLMPFTVL